MRKKRTELLLKFEMIASHSLSGYEKPHPHIWKIQAGLVGEPIAGRIVDLPTLRTAFEAVLGTLKGTYLNENQNLEGPAREFPTCETLGESLYEKFEGVLAGTFRAANASIRLSFVQVALCEMDGFEQGAARITTAS